MKHLLPCILLLLLVAPAAQAQATPAAVEHGDLKVGAGLVLAHPDYSPQNEAGFAVFGDFDFLDHLGADVQVHRVGGAPDSSVHETTYEAGVRFLWTFNPYLPGLGRRQVTPFVRGAAGVGTFYFKNSSGQNATYGIYGAGGGLDYNLVRKVDARVEYEYQRWASFTPNGLQPNLLTIGLTYRLR